MNFRLAASVLLVSASFAHAQGSLDTNEILPLLKTKPKVADFLLSNLELHDSAMGTRLGFHWENLGGARIGPYEILAKPKGAKEWTVQLHLCVRTTFLDAQGNALDKDAAFEKAVGFEETLVSVQIEEISSKAPRCPE